MKIVRTDSLLEMPITDAALRDMGHDLVLLPDGVALDILLDAVADADLLLMCYTAITAEVIAAAPKLKGIVKYGVGIDAIDIPAAIAREIPVVNIPEYAEETVAEGAFAMLIALAKKLTALHGHMSETGWAWPEPTWLGTDIAGKTVGLVGFGRIGQSMARMAGLGFRARVLAYDPYVSAFEMRSAGVEKCETLDAMLKQADFVSVHTVLNNDTKHLIDASALALMKSSAFLINVSRGAIVDETALLDALKSGAIAGAGLDVFSVEPLALDGHPLSELFAMPNVILSPHLTFYTDQAMERLERETLERCEEVLTGELVYVKSGDPRLREQTVGVRFD